MLVSGFILAMYLWVLVSDAPIISEVLFISDLAAIAAGLAFVVATISYLWTPRHKLLTTALASYSILVVMVCLLVVSTGNLSSPFIALWMMTILFSVIFGWLGVSLGALAVLAFVVWELTQGTLGIESLVIALLVTAGPIVVGLLAMRPVKENEEDRSYHELVSELSSVSGKAEVVIAAIADGVLALDSKGVIQLINPAAQNLIGWGKNDAIGLDYKSVLKITDDRDKEVDPISDPVRQALDTNKATHTESFSLMTADSNKKFLASLTISPVGSLGSGVIVVFRDITAEKAEEREQAEFISTASHEMRTPVASIEGYLGLALNPQTAQVDDKAREYIGKAQESAKHLGRLFQDLLDVSRADDGRLSHNPRVVDVVPFLGDIVQGLAPTAIEKGVRTVYKPDPDFSNGASDSDPRGERKLSQVLYVNVDNDHLREVLSNIVENAIKYTPSGDIIIDASGDDQHVTISVSDSGIGIPKEDIPHLFQKFYRVDNTETREIGGTGLGLYLCRKLTEAMGGQIWAESQYRQGSTFYVRLPRIDHVDAKELIEQASADADQSTQPMAEIHSVASLQATQPAPATPMPPPPSPPVQSSVPTPPAAVTGANTTQPPSPNQAPVYTPTGRENTPLDHIESNPTQYIESQQNQPPSQGQPQP